MTVDDSYDYFVRCVHNRGNWKTGERQGQYAFNLLYRQRYIIADLLRATEFDPFYDDDRLDAFFEQGKEWWDVRFTIVDEDALRVIRRAAEHWCEYLEENDREDEVEAIDDAARRLSATVVEKVLCSNCGRDNPLGTTLCVRCNQWLDA